MDSSHTVTSVGNLCPLRFRAPASMTIRRDLIDLEKQGLLVRVHGGAHKKVKDSLLEGFSQ